MPHKAQPGALRAGPPRRADRAAARPRPCTSPPPSQVDERPDGAWHAEWATAAHLLAPARSSPALADRPSCSTGSQVARRTGWPRRSRPRRDDVLAEQRSHGRADRTDRATPTRPSDYLGATGVARSTLALDRADEEDRVTVPTITAVRLTGARPRRAAAARARPVARHLGDRRCGRACAARPGRRLRRGRLGPARARPQPRRCPTSRSPWPSSPRACCTSSTTCSPSAGELGGSFVYAGDSVGGAVGLQLLLDAPRPGRRGGAAVHRRQDRRRRRCGPSGSPGRAPRARRCMVTGSAERWFGAGLPRPRARARLGAAARAAGRRRRRATSQVCEALADVRRPRPARRDRRAGARRGREPTTSPPRPTSCARSPTASRDGRSSSSTASRTWRPPRRPADGGRG